MPAGPKLCTCNLADARFERPTWCRAPGSARCTLNLEGTGHGRSQARYGCAARPTSCLVAGGSKARSDQVAGASCRARDLNRNVPMHWGGP